MTKREIEILHILGELYDYWKNHPELRLGQIIVNFTPPHHDDPFYMPDSYYRAAIQAQLAHENKEVKDV